MLLSDMAESTVQTYQNIVDGGLLSWVILVPETEVDSVIQVATGTGDLDELKRNATNDVFFAFIRQPYRDANYFAFIVHIPDSLSGVRKARVLVQSRRLGIVFNARHATVTINHLDNLTVVSLHDAFANSISVMSERAKSLRSLSASADKELPKSPGPIEMRRSVSDNTTQSSTMLHSGWPTSKIPILPKGPSFSGLLRKIKRINSDLPEDLQRRRSESEDMEVPPPVPPKDMEKTLPLPVDVEKVPPLRIRATRPQHDTSISETRLTSFSQYSATDDVPDIPSPISAEFEHIPDSPGALWNVIEAEDATFAPEGASTPPKSSEKAPRKVRFITPDPEERMHKRIEAQRLKEAEMKQQEREEAERQEQLRLEKLRIRQQEQEEEERRRFLAAAEAKMITAARAQKARERREAEERKTHELRERKIEDQRRRQEASRHHEEWIKRQTELNEQAARRKAESQRLAAESKRLQIKAAEIKIRNAEMDDLRTGWVTVQTNESLEWRRRFYRVTGTAMLFFRTPEDASPIVDRIDYRGVRAIRESDEGYEELEAISHSFAIEFKDGQGSWAMFADTAEEKIKLLGLLHQIAGLKTY